MAHLLLLLLGPFQTFLGDVPLRGYVSNKVRGLLTYLAVETDRPHHRERLADLFWPNLGERAARGNLRYALANLRKVIGDHQAEPPFLKISRRTIQFNQNSAAMVDVLEFQRLLNDPTQTISAMEQANSLYRGEFLEGFSIRDSAAFDEWLLVKREQINRQLRSTRFNLASNYEARGEYTNALVHAWSLVELEPFQESASRQLMRLLALTDQRETAISLFEVCKRTLVEEFNIEPTAETTQLFEHIRDGKIKAKAD